ncbi:hypothetical protein SPRG_19717 [Saprolegnia parasitica CBS 223.65]|uniref:EGF-like domain-containing protein n=1 Tax=Saprolegnia parasitica (strain CBS 223.65) TaxID=695850 RepID=A0A067CSQ6_SAPPC|nr:hypothetical protein SPRG_19717 [Saprolegnia parasitica CBS 223.65]KDO29832.1 hypothetical protein SPRG_19717 [Saprolegnia parasitica CBS 223.65]|eukprot:XP_012199536.1 hypothetical protein SPRG_19717 [Saprolegnia parasitica CBS 223.65]
MQRIRLSRLLLAPTILAVTSALDGCQQCEVNRNCATAYRNAPGQFCGHWLTSTGAKLGCCCPTGAICATTNYACECKNRPTTSSSSNGGLIGGIIGGVIFICLVVGLACFFKRCIKLCCSTRHVITVPQQAVPVAVPMALPMAYPPQGQGGYPGQPVKPQPYYGGQPQAMYPGQQPQQVVYPGQQGVYPGQQAMYPGQQAMYPGQQVMYQQHPQPVMYQPQPQVFGGAHVVVAPHPVVYGGNNGFVEGMIVGGMLDGGHHHHHFGGFGDGGDYGRDGGDFGGGCGDGGGGTFGGDF